MPCNYVLRRQTSMNLDSPGEVGGLRNGFARIGFSAVEQGGSMRRQIGVVDWLAGHPRLGENGKCLVGGVLMSSSAIFQSWCLVWGSGSSSKGLP